MSMDNLTEPSLGEGLTKSWAARAISRVKRLVGLGVDRAFSATRWFAVLGLITISAVSIGTARVLSRIMVDGGHASAAYWTGKNRASGLFGSAPGDRSAWT